MGNLLVGAAGRWRASRSTRWLRTQGWGAAAALAALLLLIRSAASAEFPAVPTPPPSPTPRAVAEGGVSSTTTPSPTDTPLPTCGATGTPYCADQCSPCPTIREGCLARDCGLCVSNPECSDGDVCVPRELGPPFGCCTCASPTPTPTPIETPTCAATGTPYCADQCMPCPTIRENCLARGCGRCIVNPECSEGEVCAGNGTGPPYGCCECVTPTPNPSRAVDDDACAIGAANGSIWWFLPPLAPLLWRRRQSGAARYGSPAVARSASRSKAPNGTFSAR